MSAMILLSLRGWTESLQESRGRTRMKVLLVHYVFNLGWINELPAALK